MTLPGRMKRAPSSAIVARALMDVSANRLPRCSQHSTHQAGPEQQDVTPAKVTVVPDTEIAFYVVTAAAGACLEVV